MVIEEAAALDRDPSEWSFDVGVAISVYQNSGGPNTQWETFEQQKRWFGRPTIAVRDALCRHAGISEQRMAGFTLHQWRRSCWS